MDNKALLQLLNVRVSSIGMNTIEKSEEYKTGEFTFEIELSFNYEDFENDSVVRSKSDLKGNIDNIDISLTSISEVKVLEPVSDVNNYILENETELAKPGLLKSSMIVNELYEYSTGFPLSIDIYDMYLDSKDDR